MSPEKSTPKLDQSAEAQLSYSKQLEKDLATAHNPVEKIGAVNSVLEQFVLDADAGKVRKTEEDPSTHKSVEKVYGKKLIQENLALLYDQLYGDESKPVSLEAVQHLMTRVNGFRNVMNSLLSEDADPVLKEATKSWLKKNYEQIIHNDTDEVDSDTLDESLLETKPRSELIDDSAASIAEFSPETEPSAEDLKEFQEDAGELAVEQVVEEPHEEADQSEESQQESDNDNEEQESLKRRKLDSLKEELSAVENSVLNRLSSFVDDTRRMQYQIQGDNYPAGAVATLLQRQGEQVPSLIAMVGLLKENEATFEQSATAEDTILNEEQTDMIKNELRGHEIVLEDASRSLRGIFEQFDTLAGNSARGEDVSDDIARIAAQSEGIVRDLHARPLARSLSSILS